MQQNAKSRYVDTPQLGFEQDMWSAKCFDQVPTMQPAFDSRNIYTDQYYIPHVLQKKHHTNR